MKRVAITTRDFYYASELTKKLLEDERVERILVIGKDLSVPVVEKIVYINTLPYFPLATIFRENKIDTIINFVKIDDETYSNKEAYSLTLQSLENILASGARGGVENYILYSSTIIYGVNKKKKGKIFKPERLKKPGSRFYYSKLRFETEKLIYEFMDEFPHFNVKITRVAFTLGANIDNLISSYLSLKFLPQVAHHNPEFEFVHEADVIRAFHHLIFNGERGIYNISSDDSISLKEIAEVMNSKLVSIPKIIARQIAFLSWHIIPSVIKIPPYTIDFFAYSFLTDNNSLKATGFKFKYSLKDTIAEFKKYRSNFHR